MSVDLTGAYGVGMKALAAFYGESIEDSSYALDARLVIDNALPLIEAKVRESIATEIEASFAWLGDRATGSAPMIRAAMTDAAAVARGAK